MKAIHSPKHNRFYTRIKQDHHKIDRFEQFCGLFYSQWGTAWGTHFRAVTGRLFTMCPCVKTKKDISQDVFVLKELVCLYPSDSLYTMIIRNIRDIFAGQLRNSKMFNDQLIRYFTFSVKFNFYLLLISHLNIWILRNPTMYCKI